MERVYNFAAGPSAMPEEALRRAASEMLCYGDTGVSVMEMSHRAKMYLAIWDEAMAVFKRLMGVPEGYTVLFLQGGATGQFAAVPMNLIGITGKADYVDTGNFASGAMKEAQRYGDIKCAASSKADGYTYIPELSRASFREDASYVHITGNNTIFGTRYTELPDTGDIPLCADLSSSILSEPYDVSRFGVIYAGAQKNIGPAGLTVVIVRNDLMGHALPICPKVLNYAIEAEKDSMLNTPPTYSVYMAKLCMEWLEAQGGVKAIEQVNIEKARLLYDFIDNSSLFKNNVDPRYRSRMNVTCVTGSPELDDAFVKGAAKHGLIALKGHRLVGGIRASIYNAMPIEGVKALIEYMKQFELKNR